MRDPFITAVNTEKAALSWFNDLAFNASNIYTPGFRERRMIFSDFINGASYQELPYKADQGKAIPGRASTNMFIEGKGMFVVRKADGSQRYTRLGDFKFDAGGTLVNELGDKVQGYMTDEKGNVLNTGQTGSTSSAPGTSPNNPAHSAGGTAHLPTTEINMWVDPSNGKFFGKYDEYKVKADGTVMGMADKGKVQVPLYKVALANFVNPEGLSMAEDNYYVASEASGKPVEGSGEIQMGLLEKSNVFLREQVNYLTFAKLQLDVSQKLISTNKQLLQESLRLIQ